MCCKYEEFLPKLKETSEPEIKPSWIYSVEEIQPLEIQYP
jgi:hypothetical protein